MRWGGGGRAGSPAGRVADTLDWRWVFGIRGALAIAVFGALIAGPNRFLAGRRVSLTIAAAVLLATAVVSLRDR
jgi:hypothetical protein